MKKVLILFCLITFLRCGDNSKNENTGVVESVLIEEDELFFDSGNQNESAEIFRIRFLDSNKNNCAKFNLGDELFVDITYPNSFKRTTFNLYELLLMEANKGWSLASLMVPYSDYTERDGGIEIKIVLENNDDMKQTIDFYKEEIDKKGRLKLYVDLKDNSFFLQSKSDTIFLLTRRN
jgi:hypothetical protein